MKSVAVGKVTCLPQWEGLRDSGESALWKVCEATCFMKARHQVKTDDRKGENP